MATLEVNAEAARILVIVNAKVATASREVAKHPETAPKAAALALTVATQAVIDAASVARDARLLAASTAATELKNRNELVAKGIVGMDEAISSSVCVKEEPPNCFDGCDAEDADAEEK
jgi:uncharacterized protein (UPF0333 family)